MKPRIFIGSSKEGHKLARAVQANLQPMNECVVWDQGFFDLNKVGLDSLIDKLSLFDFAVFVMSPDDQIVTRGTAKPAARDNVIFEIGLFMGRLGKERTFMVMAGGETGLNLPTDFLGITTGRYDPTRADRNWKAELAPACDAIQTRIDQVGPVSNKSLGDEQGQRVKYVAAICYQVSDGQPHLLLVKSTKERRIFPKGRIKDGEGFAAAAVRYASEEGGIHAEILDTEPILFSYHKEDRGEDMNVAGVLLAAVNPPQQPHKSEVFREPAWFSLEEAGAALRLGRTWSRSEELGKVLIWAQKQIRLLAIPRYHAGTVPFKRRSGKLHVLLVTSRGGGKWIFPKGKVQSDARNRDVAMKETYEEAGVRGKLKQKIGEYTYRRLGASYLAHMYTLQVEEELDNWPEKRFRDRAWVRLSDAADLIQHEDVKQVLIDFEKIVGE